MWTEPAPVQSSPVQKSGPALGPDCGPDLRSGSLEILLLATQRWTAGRHDNERTDRKILSLSHSLYYVVCRVQVLHYYQHRTKYYIKH
jgi:hypothetical protein